MIEDKLLGTKIPETLKHRDLYIVVGPVDNATYGMLCADSGSLGAHARMVELFTIKSGLMVAAHEKHLTLIRKGSLSNHSASTIENQIDTIKNKFAIK